MTKMTTKTITTAEFLEAVKEVSEQLGNIAVEAFGVEGDKAEWLAFIEAQKFAVGCRLLWERLTDGQLG